MELATNMNNIMKKATFDEIYKILNGDDNLKDILECFSNMFSFALLFFPGFMCEKIASITHINDEIDLLTAYSAIKDCIKSVKDVLKKNKALDYYTQYNNIQIANFMLVFAAYFDAMTILLPDESAQIQLSDSEKFTITKNAIEKYLKLLNDNKNKENSEVGFFDFSITLPSPVIPFKDSLLSLKSFYIELNGEFKKFYEGLLICEKEIEHNKDRIFAIINSLPDKAILNFKSEYFALKSNFPLYSEWAQTQEHNKLYEKIDVGFNKISNLIESLNYVCANETVKEVFNFYDIKYANNIRKKILAGDNKDIYGIKFPLKEEIFIPQSFKYLVYKKGEKLEHKSTWDKLDKKEYIDEFIRTILRDPIYGKLPIVILGNPGAGKSMLCDMLAAKVLCQEYHVIIIRLRDINISSDMPIGQQVSKQILLDNDIHCEWNQIRKTIKRKGDKPLLLIFDGFDELLQVTGKTYCNFLKKISDFQVAHEEDHGFLVKCIITSRINMIDVAEIDGDSIIINLQDFEYKRINTWISIWNNKNDKYFKNNDLNPLEINNTDNYYELAKQPLLLTMLALFDTNNNALKKSKNLNETQLYYSLIRDFVIREQEKDNKFSKYIEEKRNEIIDNEINKLNIAAMGMYNRNSLYISSKELNKDFKFYNLIDTQETFAYDTFLTESEKTFLKFLFIYATEVKTQIHGIKRNQIGYQFLHNTFGEFLTANFLVDNIYNILNNICVCKNNNIKIPYDNLNLKWYTCMSYVPLFTRINIIKMINQWGPHYFTCHELDIEDAKDSFRYLINKELNDIISGEKIIKLKQVIIERTNPFELNDLFVHLAIYSANLVILSCTLFGSEYVLKDFNQRWNKMINIWRCAFDEDGLYRFSNVCRIHKDDSINSITVKYRLTSDDEITDEKINSLDRISKIYEINTSLGDELNTCITGALLGRNYLEYKIMSNNLKIKSIYSSIMLLRTVLLKRKQKIDFIQSYLIDYEEYIFEENREEFFYLYYLLLNNILSDKKIYRSLSGEFINGRIIKAISLILNKFFYLFKSPNIIFKLIYKLFDYFEKDYKIDSSLLNFINMDTFFMKNSIIINIAKIKVFNIFYQNIDDCLISDNLIMELSSYINRIIDDFCTLPPNCLIEIIKLYKTNYALDPMITINMAQKMICSLLNNCKVNTYKEIFDFIINIISFIYQKTDYTVYNLKNILQNCKNYNDWIVGLLSIEFTEYSNETLYNFCLLVDLDFINLFENKKIINNLINLLKIKKEDIPIKLCSLIRKLGKKFGSPEIIQLTDDLLK